jgi:hypothetical protein
MIVRSKHNLANDLCTFALQGVKERKERHESVQKFMLCNDSVTVATEVPVYLNKDDIEHMQTQLGFQIFAKQTPQSQPHEIASSHAPRNDNGSGIAASIASLLPRNDESAPLPKLITGHIDILQIRNGQIHILDYKPNAVKERPIEQLTLYAMALSRLTGLRLFEFKCAWFDEKDYFEFYPLHVLHKPRSSRRRRKVYTGEGMYRVNKNVHKIDNMRPEDRQAPSSNYSL